MSEISISNAEIHALSCKVDTQKTEVAVGNVNSGAASRMFALNCPEPEENPSSPLKSAINWALPAPPRATDALMTNSKARFLCHCRLAIARRCL
jgi:hypothetical protein